MSELSQLQGVGPKREKALHAAGLETLRQLVYHLPRRYLDRTRLLPIASLREGEDGIFTGRIEAVNLPKNRLILEVADAGGSIDLVFFGGLQFLRRRFQVGQRILAAGKPGRFHDTLQIVHPEVELLEEDQAVKGSILPRYPLTEALSESHVDHKFLQRIALEALERFEFADAFPAALRERLDLRPEKQLLQTLHQPRNMGDLPRLRDELKWRELLPLMLRLEKKRLLRRARGRAWTAAGKLEAAVRQVLPFALTPGQEEAVRSIRESLAGSGRFEGLLQGDVGAGKTVVALLGACAVLEAGGQVAFMAPTEILAQQHHRTLSAWLESTEIRIALLTGDTPRAERQGLLESLAAGRLALLVGTHALFSSEVRFRELGLAVIDEQHRFGVEQRKALAEKNPDAHLLNLSATPIPRSLAQTVFADLDTLVLRDKPKGRLPIKTRLVPAEKRADMTAFLLREVEAGNQVFWVVPLIVPAPPPSEDEDRILEPSLLPPKEDPASVERIWRELSSLKPGLRVDFLHGRRTAEEKEATLREFRAGRTRVLVATTVIEVGVDIPSANLMVIEDPDRFGLAQLHQLRGRTGRGEAQAWCFLALPNRPLEDSTWMRLRDFADTLDGFRIAEIDLQARGTGNLEGTAQSGFGALRFTDLLRDFELTRTVREAAREILAEPGAPGAAEDLKVLLES